ncbi:MAG: hydroxymethylglutaryl-CoA lyase, partial [Acidimicrobiales bacterium]
MSPGPPPSVRVRDVTLRDGLQDEPPVATGTKLALLDALVASGLRDLELTSFARPDRVPATADAEAMAREAPPRAPGVTLWGLVLNRRGAERALAAGLDHLQFVVSVSERHNQANAGRTVAASLAELEGIVALAGTAAEVEATLSTAFGCPYAGPVEPAEVLAVAARAREAGAVRLTLGDTIGTGVPTEVGWLVAEVAASVRPVELGIHLHDTRGLAVANALAALEAGATRVDGTVGGLGGCPFAPGASGNLPLEDLVHALGAMGSRTGVDLGALLAAADLACAAVGRAPSGHVAVAGPRFS